MIHQVSKLTLALASILATTTTFAAGLDRSGQDVTAFFQDGTYAEAVYTYIDADITGKDVAGNNVDDIAEAYDFFRWGMKTDINDRTSLGILYDEPFGAAVKYTGDNMFVSNADPNVTTKALKNVNVATLNAIIQGLENKVKDPSTSNEERAVAIKNLTDAKLLQGTAGITASQAGESTNVEIRSESVTGLVGYKFGENKNFQLYGGPVLQRLKGEVHLRGPAYRASTGYDNRLSPSTEVGWAAGMAYYKPEIGLKAALTYRSEIDYDSTINEVIPFANAISNSNDPFSMGLNQRYQKALAANVPGKIKLTTPESFNFNFQTGLNKTTLATAKVRYVPWSDFTISPPAYNAMTQAGGYNLPILNYDDDQWQVELGVAKRLNPKLAVSGTVGWDSGAGNPTSSLGPVEGYYSAGLGAKYNVTDNWAVSAGGKYLWFGDATGSLPTKREVGHYEDNEGFILGVKLSYQDK